MNKFKYFLIAFSLFVSVALLSGCARTLQNAIWYDDYAYVGYCKKGMLCLKSKYAIKQCKIQSDNSVVCTDAEALNAALKE